MYLIVGVLLLAAGLLFLVSPRVVFTVTENWKQEGDVEPSRLFLLSVRLGGVMMGVVGAAAAALSLLGWL